MSPIDRRGFLAATAGAAAYLSSPRAAGAAALEPPQVPLGKTGIKMSRVGQGTGMHGGNRQSNHTRMGFDKLHKLFLHAYERGITFFDLADLYGTHVYFREALRTIPREKVAILTKLWWRYDGPTEPAAEGYRKGVAKATIERFLHEVATDYLDIVLLHCMSTHKWTTQLAPYMDALSEAKDKKQVRAVGVSCHDFGAMETAAEAPWVDVILARINPRGVKMDGTPDQVVGVLQKARQNGKAVIGMKIFGEGELARQAQQREECIRFAQTNGVLDAMTIGFEAPGQIDETLRLLAKYPVPG